MVVLSKPVSARVSAAGALGTEDGGSEELEIHGGPGVSAGTPHSARDGQFVPETRHPSLGSHSPGAMKKRSSPRNQAGWERNSDTRVALYDKRIFNINPSWLVVIAFYFQDPAVFVVENTDAGAKPNL